MPAAELSGAAARERQAEEAEQDQAPEIVEADTAFLVYRRTDGQIVMTEDINAPVVAARAPNHDDVFQIASVIVKDLTAQQIAGLTTQNVMLNLKVAGEQMARAQQSAPMTEEVVRKLRREGLIK